MKSEVSQNTDVVIVGSGCSGVLTAVHILRRWRKEYSGRKLSITIVGDGEKLGRGVAYGTECVEHLLNVPAKGMSAIADEPNHFFDWLNARDSGTKPETFAPRMVYGDYIQRLLRQEQMQSSQDVEITFKNERAVALSQDHAFACVRLVSGQEINCEAVVLATGNFPPEQSVMTGWFNNFSDRYHDNPWSDINMRRVRQDDDVLMIGTGLTMIDIALQLRAIGHRGRLTALSRHGYLPRSHFHDGRIRYDNPSPYLPTIMPERLNGVFRLLRMTAELAELDGSGNWRYVMNELRLITPRLWKNFTTAEKRRFMRHVRHIWEAHRHRMAPEIAEKLAELVSSGTMNLYAGRILNVAFKSHRFDIQIKRRGGESLELKCDHVFNCTGPQTDLRKIQDPLVKTMFANGLLRSDDLGLGALIDDNGALVDRTGKPSERLFAVGSLRKGHLWESTAVPELREQASHVANIVCRLVSYEAAQTVTPAGDRQPAIEL